MKNYEIKENVLTVEAKDSYQLEVNLVSWYGNEPVIDIRRWSKDHERMTKGITMTKEEYEQIGGKL